MVEANANTAARMARMGMPLITPSQGLTALASTLSRLHQGTCLSQLAALPLDATALLAHGNLSALTVPLIADLAGPQHVPNTEHSAVEALDQVTSFQTKQPHSIQQVLATVSSVVSNILGFTVPATTPLMAAGLDSLASVEVTHALQVELGSQLPPTLVSLVYTLGVGVWGGGGGGLGRQGKGCTHSCIGLISTNHYVWPVRGPVFF